MEGVAVVVDGEGFVGCVRGLRDALAGLPVVVGLLPSSRAAHGVVARGYDVVVPEKLRTLDRGRPWRDSQFASTRLSPSRDMSR